MGFYIGPQDNWYINTEDIPQWCAAVKVSKVTSHSIQWLDWETIASYCGVNYGASVVCISTNETEFEVIEWLKKNKFSKSKLFNNWNHSGRRTQLWLKQIPKKYYPKDDYAY